MTSLFVRKLEAFAPLSGAERCAVDALHGQVVTGKAGDDLIMEGARPDHVRLVIDGWAYRYKLLPDGGRQILACLIPGDLCDIHAFLLQRMDHSIGLLSDATVGLISEKAMTDLLAAHPRIARALFRARLVDEATLRAWLTNTLRREPFERLAHLLCELRARLHMVGLADGHAFGLPLTQAALGDMIGLNAVTVNRTLQRLRGEGLITLKQGRLVIPDPDRLAALSGFDPNYLHLGGKR